MKIARVALGLSAEVVLAGAAGWSSLDNETRTLLATRPTHQDVPSWSEPQRDAGCRTLA
jgi:hypothetical protein